MDADSVPKNYHENKFVFHNILSENLGVEAGLQFLKQIQVKHKSLWEKP